MLLARSRQLLATIDDIKAEVRTENLDPSGTVRIGAPPSLGDILFAPLAQVIVSKFPRVRLELSEGLTEAVSDKILKGELDLAIATAPTPNDHLAYELLMNEPVFVIGPPGDPLLKRGRLTKKQFASLPSAVGPLSRTHFPATVPLSLRVDNSTPLKRMVTAGLGYGLLSYSGFHEEISAGTLSAALVPWLHAERILVLPRRRPVSRAARETMLILKQVCSYLIAEGKIRTTRQSSLA